MSDQIEFKNRMTYPFTMIPNHAFVWKPIIGIRAFAIYCDLLMYAGQNRQCFPSIRTLAANNGTGKDQVREAIDTLAEKGLIEKQRRGNRSNLYTIPDCPTPPGTADPKPIKRRDVPGAGTHDSQKNAVVYPERVHGVPGAGTEQDLRTRLSKESDSSNQKPEEIADQELEAIQLALFDEIRAAPQDIAAAARSIRDHGGRAEEVRSVVRSIRSTWSDPAFVTPRAVANHWPSFLAGIELRQDINGSDGMNIHEYVTWDKAQKAQIIAEHRVRLSAGD